VRNFNGKRENEPRHSDLTCIARSQSTM